MRIPLLCALLCVSSAGAAPMGFQGSYMLMGDFGRNWAETGFNYAFTARDALGLGVMTMYSDDGSHDRGALELNYTRLVARWNLPDAQANIWFFAGLGRMRGTDFDGTHAFASPGVQLDYETTRLYLAALVRLYRADRGGGGDDTVDDGHGHGGSTSGGHSSLDHDYVALRAGYAFTEAVYESTQPWLVVEARRIDGLMDRTEITPMLRLINKNWFVEAGLNDKGYGRLNFMYTY
jgi:hypothetical protein